MRDDIEPLPYWVRVVIFWFVMFVGTMLWGAIWWLVWEALCHG